MLFISETGPTAPHPEPQFKLTHYRSFLQKFLRRRNFHRWVIDSQKLTRAMEIVLVASLSSLGVSNGH